MPDNKRRFTRVPFRAEAELNVDGVIYAANSIENLGIGGCLLPLSAALVADAACTVKIVMSGTSSELNIKAHGNILRSNGNTVAIKFAKIDPDSLYHLKNIIRYNASDPDAVEGEIFDTTFLADE
jgi:hypothetical protein